MSFDVQTALRRIAEYDALYKERGEPGTSAQGDRLSTLLDRAITEISRLTAALASAENSLADVRWELAGKIVRLQDAERRAEAAEKALEEAKDRLTNAGVRHLLQSEALEEAKAKTLFYREQCDVRERGLQTVEAKAERFREALQRLMEIIDPSNAGAVELVCAALSDSAPIDKVKTFTLSDSAPKPEETA